MTLSTTSAKAKLGRQLALFSIISNTVLSLIKIAAGMLGHSNALIADGIESSMDIFSSALIWGALKYAEKPPDREHPYGHGKIESLAAVVGALFLLGAGTSVAWHSIKEIWLHWSGQHTHTEHPAAWTLLVLVGVIVFKEILFRILHKQGAKVGSTALQADAWHHRSDAITSVAAFLGISLALIGGKAWVSADDWAALFSCGIIFYNGFRMLRRSIGEVMDERHSDTIIDQIEQLSLAVNGVSSIEKCRVRKSGLSLIADLHVRVGGAISVREGHAIGHEVKDRLIASGLHITDVIVHIEPED